MVTTPYDPSYRIEAEKESKSEQAGLRHFAICNTPRLRLPPADTVFPGRPGLSGRIGRRNRSVRRGGIRRERYSEER